ncbi:hypothetical protein TIFTF001_048451, partial [Ficus carica]
WNGYLKNDTIIVEVEFLTVSETKAFPEIKDGKEESDSSHSSGNKTGSESEK